MTPAFPSLLAACAACLLHAAASAQPTPPPAEPTLDDLLGIPRGQRDPAALRPDAGTAELDRQLDDEPAGDDFEQAVTLMDDTAQRLEAADPGLDTQRLQEQILRKLDKMIADAQKKQSGGKGKPKPKPGDQPQPGQPQSSQAQPGQPSPTNQAGNPSVPRQDGTLGPPPPSSSATWGGLPEHVRQSLTQGSTDRFSSLYRALTEQYYKRLAEDPRGGPK